MIYLRHVERARPHAAPSETDRVYPPPQFIIPLRDAEQFEGGKIHFEARIEPVGDPSMVVEWFVNGKPLEASKSQLSIMKNESLYHHLFQAQELLPYSVLDL